MVWYRNCPNLLKELSCINSNSPKSSTCSLSNQTDLHRLNGAVTVLSNDFKEEVSSRALCALRYVLAAFKSVSISLVRSLAAVCCAPVVCSWHISKVSHETRQRNTINWHVRLQSSSSSIKPRLFHLLIISALMVTHIAVVIISESSSIPPSLHS